MVTAVLNIKAFMKKELGSKKVYITIMIVIIVLQMIAAFYFCTQKQGCHYDEYYSYYSSNVTSGLIPTDNAWMNSEEIRNEFMVTDGMGFEYGMVKLMQTYDVHPPLYYFVLHTVCSLTKNIFSLWQGLGINLFFFLLTILMIWKVSDLIGENQYINIFAVALYGFSPANISGVTFIRMYMMLTFMCMVSIYIHIRALKRGEYGWKNLYLPVLISTFLGFMTHYYFAVFMFFTAAYVSIFLFIKKETRKQAFYYAASVIIGMALVVLVYPSCLGHIFRGYRGTEAIGAFVDAANLSERAGLFVGLLQEYVLCNTFYILLLVIILLAVTYFYKKKSAEEFVNKSALWLVIVVTAGYFLIVLKTALTNAEEAIRYEMPIYGLLILLIVLAVFGFAGSLISRNEIGLKAAAVLLMIAVVLQIMGLMSDKVLFLYKGDSVDYAWADEHADDPIVYIYNYENQWMIWDDSIELMKYDRIFFIDMNNEDEITDSDVRNADRLYVFSVRSDKAAERINSIVEANGYSSSRVVRELKYVDVYELQ